MRSRASAPWLPAHAALAIVATLAWPAVHLSSQSVNVTTAAGAVHVQAPGFRFVDGDALARLKDGQSVRVELVFTMLAKPGASTFAERRQTFVLSYDLWEERFAVTTPGKSSPLISHLTAPAAEAWCVQQVAVPVSAMGPFAKLPFWIRLESRVADGVSGEGDDEEGLTLRNLIDVFSRRRKTGTAMHAIEAGPFRVQE